MGREPGSSGPSHLFLTDLVVALNLSFSVPLTARLPFKPFPVFLIFQKIFFSGVFGDESFRREKISHQRFAIHPFGYGGSRLARGT
jgi:hypothetical protein